MGIQFSGGLKIVPNIHNSTVTPTPTPTPALTATPTPTPTSTPLSCDITYNIVHFDMTCDITYNII